MKQSIDEKIESWLKQYAIDIRLFLMLFFANIFIYGQKIFFYSLAPEDFSRFYNGGGEQASWLGRWAGGLINQHIFTGPLHVLPYINGIIGIFSFTLAAYLTAKILKRSRSLEICIVTLLITVTPMVAYNLYYTTNIAVWISTMLGVLGLYLFQKDDRRTKFLGFLFFVISIGCYQTIVQIGISIAMMQLLLQLIESKNQKVLKSLLVQFALMIGFVFLAFGLSSLINHFYVQINHLEIADRMKTASENIQLSTYWNRIPSMFHSDFGFMFFRKPILVLYRSMALLALIASIWTVIQGNQKPRIKLVLSCLVLLMFLYIPLIINLPNITGNSVPLRAHYTIGWFLAGFFVVQTKSIGKWSQTIAFSVVIALIAINIFYVNVFFDAAVRQTSSDISRINQIVGRIRSNPNYSNEPIEFKVVGIKSFAVRGWNSDQQALNTDWSTDKAFRNFTDLDFQDMSDESFKMIEDELIAKGEFIESYPAKNSMYVQNGKSVLFLDPRQINNRIALSLIPKLKPTADSDYDLYMIHGKLVYFKSPCSEQDIVHPFYLHVHPRDASILQPNQMYVEMYFPFDGIVKNGQCLAVQDLPNFDIKQINTGQFSNEYNEKDKKPYTLYWKSVIQP